MKKKSGKIPLSTASPSDLRGMGLKKKSFIFPLDLAQELEHQAITEGRPESKIMADAWRAYKKEFDAFISHAKKPK